MEITEFWFHIVFLDAKFPASRDRPKFRWHNPHNIRKKWKCQSRSKWGAKLPRRDDEESGVRNDPNLMDSESPRGTMPQIHYGDNPIVIPIEASPALPDQTERLFVTFRGGVVERRVIVAVEGRHARAVIEERTAHIDTPELCP